jgi:colanic acid/amylovoran biosynthesis glycosyltransferase
MFIYNKALALAARGHSVHVVYHKKSHSVNHRYYRSELQSKNIKTYFIDSPKVDKSFWAAFFQSPISFLQSLSFKGRHLKKNYAHNYYLNFFHKIKYDVIHFEFSGLALNYLPIFDDLKGGRIVSCRNATDRIRLQFDSKKQDLMRILCNKVDLIHCESESMYTFIKGLCRHPEIVFLNKVGIDISSFKKNNDLPHSPVFTIVSAGRLSYSKNYISGLLAMKLLKEAGLIFQWKIIGDGYQIDELKYHVFSLGLNDHVVFLEHKSEDELKLELEKADVFLHSSIAEGISFEVIEAMSMQLPVITTNCGDASSIIESGVNGFLTEMYDYAAIAEAIKKLIADEALKIYMGEAARNKIESEFEINNQIEIFEKYYRKIRHAKRDQ